VFPSNRPAFVPYVRECEKGHGLPAHPHYLLVLFNEPYSRRFHHGRVPLSILLPKADTGCRDFLCESMLGSGLELSGSCAATMKVKRWAILLMFAGLALYGVQALVWRSGSRGRTETDVENRTGQHRVTEVPVIAGTALFLLAGAILMIRDMRMALSGT
jgi:hypothetical protein